MGFISDYVLSHVTITILMPMALFGIFLVSQIQNKWIKSQNSQTKLHKYPIKMSILQFIIAILFIN